ncbi:MAG: HYR domain-containing protein, partial [Saprospiraceae bacterium]|nr:HYR domain-containing protein [Saprospiraceae bacterium]
NTTELSIIANSANAACGDNFGIDFTALNFETIAGIQFTVTWDPALYQYTSISDFNLPIGIGISNFGIDSVGVGYITFAWTSPDLNGATVNNGEVLFTLNFNLLNNTASGILFGDNPTVRVAFDGGTFDEIPMMTFNGQVGIVDTVPPVIECPTPAPVDAPQGQLIANVNGLEPTTLTDNCGNVPGLSYTQTGATTSPSTAGNANGNYNAGTTTVVYTATDSNGNTATCSFQVVVNAQTPIILQLDTVFLGCQGLPTQVTVNLTVQNFIDIDGLQFGMTWDTSVIQLDPPVAIQYITAGPFPLFINSAGTLSFFGGHPSWPDVPDGDAILTFTFNVIDVNELANTVISFVGPFDALNGNLQAVPIQTFNGYFAFSLDTMPPVVSCPADTVLNALSLACDASFIPLAPTANDDCGAIASTTIFPDTTIFSVGSPTVLTYTVSDNAGNTAVCSFTVTVNSNIAPQLISCPVNITVNADSNCAAVATWNLPVFAEICQDTFTVSNNGYSSGNMFPLGGPSLVSYTATDLSNNETTCSFTVTVVDVTSPTLVCPSDTVVTPVNGCSAIVNFAMPVATDNCDTDMNVLCSDTSGTLFSGVNPITCFVLDDANNSALCSFTITVLDAQAPTFPNGCPADTIVVSASGNCGANPNWQVPVVVDNCDQNVTLIPSQGPGTFFDVANSPHTITYTATDDLGNSTTCTFTVTVEDNTPPVLTNCPPLPVLIILPVNRCDTILNWTPPTVNDNCGVGAVILTSNITPGSVFITGDTMVVYTATDASGNTSTCFFNVSVRDVIPPVIDCISQPFVIVNGNPCGTPADFPFPTAIDNCTQEVDLVFTSSYMPGDTFQIGSTTFPVIVTDASGNFDECDITVTVIGPVPGFINVPTIDPITNCQTVVTWDPLTTVGFCPPVTIDSTHASGSVFPFGTTTVMYTASDLLGNMATATFLVTITEDIAPVFDCPVSPIVVNVGGGIISDPSNFLVSTDTTAGCDAVELAYNLPNATDNCVTPTVTLLQGLPTGSLFPLGFNNLLFRAVDSSGNLSQCAVFIEVVGLPALDPQVDPSPACTGEVVTVTASNIPGATYTWIGPVTSTTNIVTINGLSVQNDGQYIVTANVNGCNTPPDTATVVLVLAPEAENDLTYMIDPGETLTFTSVLTNDNLSPISDFEICSISDLDGVVMNTSDGTFTYTAGEEPGMVSFFYVVCSKTCDLEDQAVVTITINDTKCVFIPNIITPNGDNTNDWFTIPCIDTGLFRDNTLMVYSQWGDKVYEASPYSNDPAAAWRGTLDGEDGKDLPDGVYFYIFKPGPNVPPMKGFVEIFR